MTEANTSRVLYIIVCGAGPASDVGRLVALAQERGWDVQIIATQAALGFIDAESLERQGDRPIRSQYRKRGEPRSPRADAIIVAPATYNTINKWAAGISDTYALGVLAEAPGLGVPIVVLPFVNSALAGRRVFCRSIDELREDGVRVLLGTGEFVPHVPGTGGQKIDTFPWWMTLDAVEDMSAETAS